MAKDKDKFKQNQKDADDFDFDSLDDFDFDIDGEAEEPPKNAREAATRTFKNATSGVKDAIKKPPQQHIEKILSNALPYDVKSTLSDIKYAGDDVKEVFKEGISSLRKEMHGATSLLGKYLPKDGKVRDIFDKLHEKLKPLDSGIGSEADKEAQQAAMIGTAIQQALGEQEERRKKEDLLTEKIEATRYTSSMELAAKQLANLAAIRDFNRSVTDAYFRKSLQIQYQHLYSTKEQTAILSAGIDSIKLQLENVIRNTALPDLVKLRTSEQFKEQFANNLRGKVVDYFSSNESAIGRFKNNVTKQLKYNLDEITNAMAMMVGGADMTSSLTDGTGINATSMLSEDLTSRLIGKAGAGYLNKDNRFLNNSKVAKVLGNIRNFGHDPKEFFDKLQSDNKGKSGKLASFLSKVGMFGSRFTGDASKANIGFNKAGDSEPTVFDLNTKNSIVKVIPKLLTEIHAEVKSMRTGSRPEDNRLVWDGDKEILTSYKSTLRNTRKELAGKINSSESAMNNIINMVEGTGIVSLQGEDRKAFKLALVQFILNNGTTGVTSLKNKKFIELLPKSIRKKTQAAIGVLINNSQVDPYIGDSLASSLKTIKSSIPNGAKVAQDAYNSGNLDLAMKMGAKFNKSTGGYDFDRDAYEKFVLDSYSANMGEKAIFKQRAAQGDSVSIYQMMGYIQDANGKWVKPNATQGPSTFSKVDNWIEKKTGKSVSKEFNNIVEKGKNTNTYKKTMEKIETGKATVKNSETYKVLAQNSVEIREAIANDDYQKAADIAATSAKLVGTTTANVINEEYKNFKESKPKDRLISFIQKTEKESSLLFDKSKVQYNTFKAKMTRENIEANLEQVGSMTPEQLTKATSAKIDEVAQELMKNPTVAKLKVSTEEKYNIAKNMAEEQFNTLSKNEKVVAIKQNAKDLAKDIDTVLKSSKTFNNAKTGLFSYIDKAKGFLSTNSFINNSKSKYEDIKAKAADSYKNKSIKDILSGMGVDIKNNANFIQQQILARNSNTGNKSAEAYETEENGYIHINEEEDKALYNEFLKSEAYQTGLETDYIKWRHAQGYRLDSKSKPKSRLLRFLKKTWEWDRKIAGTMLKAPFAALKYGAKGVGFLGKYGAKGLLKTGGGIGWWAKEAFKDYTGAFGNAIGIQNDWGGKHANFRLDRKIASGELFKDAWKGVKGIIGATFGRIYSGIKSSFNWLFSSGQEPPSVQETIAQSTMANVRATQASTDAIKKGLDEVKEAIAPKKNPFDKDGDGNREGSWKTRLKKAKDWTKKLIPNKKEGVDFFSFENLKQYIPLAIAGIGAFIVGNKGMMETVKDVGKGIIKGVNIVASIVGGVWDTLKTGFNMLYAPFKWIGDKLGNIFGDGKKQKIDPNTGEPMVDENGNPIYEESSGGLLSTENMVAAGVTAYAGKKAYNAGKAVYNAGRAVTDAVGLTKKVAPVADMASSKPGFLSKLWGGVKEVGAKALGFGKDKLQELWAKAQPHIDKLKTLITKKFGKAGGAKILAKLGAKLIPGIGWGLLAAELGIMAKYYFWDNKSIESSLSLAFLGTDLFDNSNTEPYVDPDTGEVIQMDPNSKDVKSPSSASISEHTEIYKWNGVVVDKETYLKKQAEYYNNLPDWEKGIHSQGFIAGNPYIKSVNNTTLSKAANNSSYKPGPVNNINYNIPKVNNVDNKSTTPSPYSGLEQFKGKMPEVKLDSAFKKGLVKELHSQMQAEGITDPKERAAFLATIHTETGGLKRLDENLNYSASSLRKVWPSRFGNKSDAELAPLTRNPVGLANVVYANRLGNGNAESGDGWNYRGKGLIQLTGKSNYADISRRAGMDYVSNPDSLVNDPAAAVRSAIKFWVSRPHLRRAAQEGNLQAVRKIVNGGLIGFDHFRNNYSAYISGNGPLDKLMKEYNTGDETTEPTSTGGGSSSSATTSLANLGKNSNWSNGPAPVTSNTNKTKSPTDNISLQVEAAQIAAAKSSPSVSAGSQPPTKPVSNPDRDIREKLDSINTTLIKSLTHHEKTAFLLEQILNMEKENAKAASQSDPTKSGIKQKNVRDKPPVDISA